MVIVGSFVGEEEDDSTSGYGASTMKAERERIYEAVYESDHWKNEIGPRVPDHIDRERTVVTRMEPTGRSVLR